ncbi:hypothetical protein [Pantanalinema sp. GBBB05]|uniref:hypothetical protein n=1 Tax=Pantanalinema sp. GBBB05 TaxID=2604139 RepID=UPI001D5FB540|nr:hypothetical protein [Pantanalinema sp. GBBB05]
MISHHYETKIITLWSTFLLGTLFHTQLGLMPLFHGIGVARADVHDTAANVAIVLWLMLAFFTLPMVAMIATTFTQSRRYRTIHLGMTVVYSVMNLLHLIADLVVTPIVWSQITLMTILFVIGLLLNLVAFQWLQSGKQSRSPHLPEPLTHS